MRSLFLIATLIATSALAASSSTTPPNGELYMPNQAGGFLVITLEKCPIPKAVKAGYDKRAYVTDGPNVKFEGCWAVSDFSKFPHQDEFTSGPAVATWWDNRVFVFEPDQFHGKKEHPYEKPTL